MNAQHSPLDPTAASLLKQAVDEHIITPSQHQQLLTLAKQLSADSSTATPMITTASTERPQFTMAHLLYYFGGLLAIGAMTLFVTLGFNNFGGIGVMLICVCYAVIGMALAYRFKRQQLLIPHSLALGFVLCLVPLFVFALQSALGVWQTQSWFGTPNYRDYHVWISWQWIFMELATLAVGAWMLYHYHRSFLMLPIAVTLWYLSMDTVSMLTGDDLNFELRRIVSLWFGLAMVLLALWIDVRQQTHKHGQDFAFWLYIFGALTFWGGLSFTSSDSHLAKFIYCLINLGLIFFGLLVMRRVFVVLGALGVFGYLSYLSWEVFSGSMIFPIVLTIIGLLVIYLGIFWQRHEAGIHAHMQRYLPKSLKQAVHKLHHSEG